MITSKKLRHFVLCGLEKVQDKFKLQPIGFVFLVIKDVCITIIPPGKKRTLKRNN